MITTPIVRLSVISALILMVLMIAFGTTPARASGGAEKGTAYYQLLPSYE